MADKKRDTGVHIVLKITKLNKIHQSTHYQFNKIKIATNWRLGALDLSLLSEHDKCVYFHSCSNIIRY